MIKPGEESSVNMNRRSNEPEQFTLLLSPPKGGSLPLDCQTAQSVNTFKIRLKTFLFDSA